MCATVTADFQNFRDWEFIINSYSANSPIFGMLDFAHSDVMFVKKKKNKQTIDYQETAFFALCVQFFCKVDRKMLSSHFLLKPMLWRRT